MNQSASSKKSSAATLNMNLEDIVKGINSGDEKQEIQATQAVREMLCMGENPPIDALVAVKVIVPKLVEFLNKVSNPTLQEDSAWALTNIAAGTSEQTKEVVRAGAVTGFIRLLNSPHQSIAEQAVWGLGNIAGDGPELRDHIIERGVMKPLLSLVKPDTSIPLLRTAAWTLLNLCRVKKPPPRSPTVGRQILSATVFLINYDDKEILYNTLWCLTYLMDWTSERIHDVIEAGIVPRLVALLHNTEVSVVRSTLRVIGVIVSGTEEQTDTVLEAGACPLLVKMLEHEDVSVVKEAAWVISNITAGNAAQIQTLITNNAIRPLLDLLTTGNSSCQTEAAWAITNMTFDDNFEHFDLLFGCVAPLCSVMRDTKDAKTILLILNGLSHFLAAAEKRNELEKVILLLEECGGLDRIETLQNHDEVDISFKSLVITKRYKQYFS